MAAKHSLTIWQGSTFIQEVVVKNSSNSAIDLAGYTGRGQLRENYDSTEFVDFTVGVSAPATGVVTISLTAVETAEAPGIGKISIAFSRHSLIRIAPGSETEGVPASETNETTWSNFKISIIFNKFFFSLNL